MGDPAGSARIRVKSWESEPNHSWGDGNARKEQTLRASGEDGVGSDISSDEWYFFATDTVSNTSSGRINDRHAISSNFRWPRNRLE